MLLKGFPKTVTLRDGTLILLRPMVREDEAGLLAFFRELPPEDRQFLRDDVTRPDLIATWARNLDYQRVLPLLAELDGRIAGDATLHRQASGWMRHVGEIRVVTDARLRRRGLATAMAREIFYLALQAGLDKMVAEMGADQVAAIKIFEKLGFRMEARLANQIVDLHGRKHDLAILSTDIPVLMQKMQESFFLAEGRVDD